MTIKHETKFGMKVFPAPFSRVKFAATGCQCDSPRHFHKIRAILLGECTGVNLAIELKQDRAMGDESDSVRERDMGL